MVAMTIFEARPKPNHSTSSGAMAKTGSAWLTTISGNSIRRVGGTKLISSASRTPSAGAGDQADHRLGQRGHRVDPPQVRPVAQRLEDAERRRQHEGRRREDDDDRLPDDDQADGDEEGADDDHRPAAAAGSVTDMPCRTPSTVRPPRPWRSGHATRRRMNPFRSFAGMTRIRFEGFDRQVISARERAPLGTSGSIAGARGKGQAGSTAEQPMRRAVSRFPRR